MIVVRDDSCAKACTREQAHEKKSCLCHWNLLLVPGWCEGSRQVPSAARTSRHEHQSTDRDGALLSTRGREHAGSGRPGRLQQKNGRSPSFSQQTDHGNTDHAFCFATNVRFMQESFTGPDRHTYEYALFSESGHINMPETFATATNRIQRTTQRKWMPDQQPPIPDGSAAPNGLRSRTEPTPSTASARSHTEVCRHRNRLSPANPRH